MPKGYSFAQIRLHWIVAVLVLFQLVFGESIAGAWRQIRDGATPASDPLVTGHVIAGLLILALVIWRLAIRAKRGAPPPPEDEAPALRLAAHGTHWALYALMILAPITGLMAWYGGVASAGEVHELLKPLMILLILVHFAAALWHQFWLKDNLLMRMKQPLD